jgi:hypothetical protein
MNILDHISESLETIVWVKILKVFDKDPEEGSGNLFDPGSGMEKIWIWDKHSGSAKIGRNEDQPKEVVIAVWRNWHFIKLCRFKL